MDFLFVKPLLPLNDYKHKKAALLDSIILSFVRASNTVRISEDAHTGSLGLLLFKYYYLAANVRALSFWQWDLPEDNWPDGSPL